MIIILSCANEIDTLTARFTFSSMRPALFRVQHKNNFFLRDENFFISIIVLVFTFDRRKRRHSMHMKSKYIMQLR